MPKKKPDSRRLRGPVVRTRGDGGITSFEAPRFALVTPESLTYDWHEDLTPSVYFKCHLVDGQEVLVAYAITGWDGQYLSLTKISGERYAEAEPVTED